MDSARSVVLDANILLRAVLGVGARRIIEDWAGEVWLCAPDVAYADARAHLPEIARNRRWRHGALDAALAVLDNLRDVVHEVDLATYAMARAEALARISERDPDDWPILATALVMGCPIWTEDHDFFGTGVPTWTTSRVELYFNDDRRWADR